MLLNYLRLIVSCWNLLPPTVHFATWHQKFGLRSQVSRERLPSYDLETAFADILKSNEACFLKNVCKIAFCNLHSSWATHCIETGCRGCFVILVQCCAPFLLIWHWQPPNTNCIIILAGLFFQMSCSFEISKSQSFISMHCMFRRQALNTIIQLVLLRQLVTFATWN